MNSHEPRTNDGGENEIMKRPPHATSKRRQKTTKISDDERDQTIADLKKAIADLKSSTADLKQDTADARGKILALSEEKRLLKAKGEQKRKMTESLNDQLKGTDPEAAAEQRRIAQALRLWEYEARPFTEEEERERCEARKKLDKMREEISEEQREMYKADREVWEAMFPLELGEEGVESSTKQNPKNNIDIGNDVDGGESAVPPSLDTSIEQSSDDDFDIGSDELVPLGPNKAREENV